jgi:hypothetical protein
MSAATATKVSASQGLTRIYNYHTEWMYPAPFINNGVAKISHWINGLVSRAKGSVVEAGILQERDKQRRSPGPF